MFSEPTRRIVLDQLATRDRQATSQHLNVLEITGLVIALKEVRYKVRFVGTTPLGAFAERWSPETREDTTP